MAGCSGSTEESAASESAVSKEWGITVTEQAPLAVTLGQAVGEAPARQGSSDGTLLEARCVGGDIHSRLDTMKQASGPGAALGTIGLAQAGVAPDGSAGLVAAPPAPVSSPFYLSPHSGNAFAGPTMKLTKVAELEDRLTENATRLGGFAETILEHNAFALQNEHRLPAASDCASRYVRGFTAKRFLLYGFTIDFAAEADLREFHTRFNSGINAIFGTDPEVQEFLIGRHAKLSAHVLVSTGLSSWVHEGISEHVCDVTNLTACKALNAKLVSMMNDLGRVPGNDDTVDATQADGSTWGAYELMIQTYDHVLP